MAPQGEADYGLQDFLLRRGRFFFAFGAGVWSGLRSANEKCCGEKNRGDVGTDSTHTEAENGNFKGFVGQMVFDVGLVLASRLEGSVVVDSGQGKRRGGIADWGKIADLCVHKRIVGR